MMPAAEGRGAPRLRRSVPSVGGVGAMSGPSRPILPALLALDFDGVLCDGRPEYFEASCRAYGHVWPPLTLARRRDLRSAFYRLRPVIMSGWEMPVLLRALVLRRAERRLHAAWADERERLVAGVAAPRAEVVDIIRKALDGVRRDWIRTGPEAWLGAHRPYVPLATLRRVVTAPPRTAVVTTKEGEFARRILESWGVDIKDVHGKERGEHKCDNLSELLADPGTGDGELWFVEDRLETLECVVRCTARDPRLGRVRLFLAAWGYNTPDARARAGREPRIRLLSLKTFAAGVASWPA